MNTQSLNDPRAPALVFRTSCAAWTSRCKVALGHWLPRFLRAPPMRFRSAHTELRNRLAFITTRENSPSDRLCQIVPDKRPSTPELTVS
jgi:hypothetical protein